MRVIGRTLAPGAVAIVLLSSHAALLLGPLCRAYITVDEVMNLAAGLSYWQTGEFFIYRVNPPPAKMLAVLPALLARPQTNFAQYHDNPTQRVEFSAGLDFTRLNSSRIFDLVRLARLAGVGWSILAGWLIYRWTRDLYGGYPGCLALALWCFEPFVLGHAPLVTVDVAAAATGLAASYAFFRHLRAPTLRTTLVAGLLLGLAVLTKFTLLVLYPVFALFWALDRWARRNPGSQTPSTAASFGQLVLTVLLSINLINLAYGCRGSGLALGDYPFNSRLFAGEASTKPGNRFRESWLGSLPVPLPEDFVRGIDVQRVDFEGERLSYLRGTWGKRGWWYFYFYVLAVKLPLGTQALILWGLVNTVVRRGDRVGRLESLMPPFVALAILALLSSQTGYTLHGRYAIPALPYLMINAGGVVASPPGRWRSRVRWLAWGLVTATALSSLRIYPHSLSYFNEAIGGPERGADYLIDSNIDWGQDLLELKRWLRRHPEVSRLGLAYCNWQIDPALAGLSYELPPPGLESVEDREATDLRTVGPRPGVFAVSVNFLRGAKFLIPDGTGEFRWVRPHEFEYFRAFRPVARAGYSISIYRITPEQAEAERRRLGLPPLEP